MDEVEQDLNRLIVAIKSENVIERKRSLEKILTLLNENEEKLFKANLKEDGTIETPCFNNWWDEKVARSIYLGLEDSGERCRETAAEIVLLVLKYTKHLNNIHLSHIFAILRHRLATRSGEPSTETSEEVRLSFLKIMIAVLKNDIALNENESKLFPYMDDVIAVLKTMLTDTYGEIKILSCEGIKEASEVFKKDFHLVGNTLINPILQCLSHRQKKVRMSAIEAVGIVMLSSTSDDFQIVAPHLAQRLFDHVPQVRLNVSLTAGKLLLEWRYGAANCAYLLPLLLTSLEDEVKENRDHTLILWKKVGKQWIENELQHDSRMKDKVDFFEDPSKWWPSNFVRHDIGCRQYITRVVSKLIPALKNDIKDWLVETRIKASSLSYILICHLEETAAVTQHAEQLLNLMQEGAMDTEIKVVKNICRMAHIYGHFVPSGTWCPLVIQRIRAQPNTCDLLLLSNILRGSNPEDFAECLTDMANNLEDDSVCLIMDDEYLEELLECLRALLRVSSPRANDIQSQLFKSSISIIALANNEQLKNAGRQFLICLSDSLGIEQLELFRQELKTQLNMMLKECRLWGSSSRRVEVFSTLLQESGPAVGFYPNLITDIFHLVLGPTESGTSKPTLAEPELQLKMFIILSRQLYNYKETLNSQNEFEQYVIAVVTDVIMPALIWRSGRKASAIRTAATTSLWSIFESGCLHPQTFIETNGLYSKLYPTINGLLEDDAEKTRLLACQIYGKLFHQFRLLVSPQILTKIWAIITKRLEDKSYEVRLACLHAIKESSLCLMSNGTSVIDAEEVENLYTTILVHMDDDTETIRKAALETLIVIGKAYPDRLLQLTEKSELNHEHKQQCTELLKHFEFQN